MRQSHSNAHGTLETLCSLAECMLEGVLDLEEEQLTALHELLRKYRVTSGAKNHVADFSMHIYLECCKEDPSFSKQCPNLDFFMSQLRHEYQLFKNNKIQSRPLNHIYYSAVERLGLKPQEWQMLRQLNSDSISACQDKLTLEQLEKEVFPPELEACRQILIKVAKKVAELQPQLL
mmetsp:Transcript_1902/g.4235  ORF Transcript_1902/g.4235 Transcript_1902/m.4235 type:complete len:176 (-) Transcript_1902:115-642(-)